LKSNLKFWFNIRIYSGQTFVGYKSVNDHIG